MKNTNFCAKESCKIRAIDHDNSLKENPSIYERIYKYSARESKEMIQKTINK